MLHGLLQVRTFDDASSLTPVYTPGVNDISAASVMIYITTDVPTGICNATMDSVLINISSGTIVSAGVDTNVCDNVDIQLNGPLAVQPHQLLGQVALERLIQTIQILWHYILRIHQKY